MSEVTLKGDTTSRQAMLLGLLGALVQCSGCLVQGVGCGV
jgi:hypothetical protein